MTGPARRLVFLLCLIPLALPSPGRSAPPSGPAGGTGRAVHILHLEKGAGHDQALAAAARALGRPVVPLHRYAAAFHGLALELTAAEAAALARLAGVRRVEPSVTLRIASDAGPAWTRASSIWDGSGTGGLPGTQGEGRVVAVIDTGIALGHASFADVGGDGYNHVNPRGAGNYAGWCDPANPDYDPSLACNDKLIGVWSYPEAGGDPRDDTGHGTHVASLAAGNHVSASLPGLTRQIAGVAPHASLIAYDVCDAGGNCPSSAVLAASARFPDPTPIASAQAWITVCRLTPGAKLCSTRARW